jgi:cation-transporting ATPase I
VGLTALVGAQLAQTLVAGRRSPLVIGTVAVSGAALLTVVQTPGLSQFFGCTPLGPAEWATAAGAAGIATCGSIALPWAASLVRSLSHG